MIFENTAEEILFKTYLTLAKDFMSHTGVQTN